MAPAISHLLYLHGFRSSPKSFKAQRLAAWLREHRSDLHWWCPQLPPQPNAAMAMLREGIGAWPAQASAVLGSSLGGFYATALAEDTGWPAVLLNPAIDPARDLVAYVGELSAYHTPTEHFDFRSEYLDQLRAMRPARISRPQRYLAIIAKGDEVLDWREMASRYADAQLRLLDGSDHALSDFDEHLPHILRFLNL